MRNTKELALLLVGFIILLLSTVTACGESHSTTYTNDDWGYAITYAKGWQVEVADAEKTFLVSSPYGWGSLRIDVIEACPAETAAENWLMLIGTKYGSVTLLEGRVMQGMWDHYLCYEYVTDYGEFHGEAFFKQTETHLYKLDTVGETSKYDTYAFDAIISTFKLLPE